MNTEITYDNIKATFPHLSDHSIDLLYSSTTDENPFMNTNAFFEWLNKLNSQVTFDTQFVPLSEMAGWHFDAGQDFVFCEFLKDKTWLIILNNVQGNSENKLKNLVVKETS